VIHVSYDSVVYIFIPYSSFDYTLFTFTLVSLSSDLDLYRVFGPRLILIVFGPHTILAFEYHPHFIIQVLFPELPHPSCGGRAYSADIWYAALNGRVEYGRANYLDKKKQRPTPVATKSDESTQYVQSIESAILSQNSVPVKSKVSKQEEYTYEKAVLEFALPYSNTRISPLLFEPKPGII